MAGDTLAVVHLADGLTGTMPRSRVERGDRVVVVTLDDGRLLEAPASAFARRDDDSFDLPIRLDRAAASGAGAETDDASRRVVIPVVAEALEVGKRTVESGKVRLRKTVEERRETVDVPLFREEVEVRRVPVDESSEPSTEIRREGDTLIVPVLEEVLVVTKVIRVREEVRVTRTRVEHHEPQTVSLRREAVAVEREGAGPPPETATSSRSSR